MDQKKIFLEETSKRKDEWRSGFEVAGELTRLAAEIADGALIISGEKLPAAGGKKLKKGISRLWKDVVKQVSEESVLSRGLAAELRKKCEDYNLSAHSQWFDAWRECADKVNACIAAAEKGDFAAARGKISEVNHLTKECHRLYK